MYEFNRIIELANTAPAGADILEECLKLAELLLEKNIAYSNSAMQPINVLSSATAEEQIRMHIDNKLTRLKHQKEYGDEDSLADLAGYIILLLVLRNS